MKEKKYQSKSLQNTTELAKIRSDGGSETAKLNQKEQLQTSVGISCQKKPLTKQKQKIAEKKSVIVESVRKNKKTISKDNSNICKTNLKHTKSGMILDPESIGNDLNSDRFWNLQKKEMSKKLWLPTETDCVDLPLSSSNLSSKQMVSQSWFSITKESPASKNLQKTCYRSCKSISVNKTERDDTQNQEMLAKIKALNKKMTEEEKTKKIEKITAFYQKKINNTNNTEIFRDKKGNEIDKNEIIGDIKKQLNNRIDEVKRLKKNPVKQGMIKQIKKKLNKRMKVKKMRVYLTEEQRKIFKQWNGTCRRIYNQMVHEYENHNITANFQELRNNYISADQVPDEIKEWMLQVPKDVRAEAIRDFCKGVDINLKMLRERKISYFNMKFRTKKREEQSFVIPHSAIKITNGNLCVYKNILKEESTIKILKTEKIPQIEFDCRIKLIKPGICYIYIPYTTDDIVRGTENKSPKIISLDPGVEPFLRGYSPNGHTLTIGKKCIKRIFDLCKKIDRLRSIIDMRDVKCRKRLRIIKKMNKLQYRLKNIKVELHQKTCKYLCDNYDVILIPKTDISKMVDKMTRNINNTVVRKLLNLGHYDFRMRLLEKSKDYKNCKVIECNEAFTSKTCTNCGKIKDDLGGNKIYKCSKCKIIIDRDVNGSRNILLRSLAAKAIIG